MRFIRWTLGLFGIFVFAATVVRLLQPPETQEYYQVIYGALHGRCCSVYLVNERTQQANRARIGLVQQEEVWDNLSPSGRWKFANVQLSIGSDYQAYFIPIFGGDLVPVATPTEQGWLHHWSTLNDTVYWFGRQNSFYAALYRASPDDPNPERLTDFSFEGIRTVQEQPLPFLPAFTPFGLFFWSLNALFIAGGLKYWQSR